ncbi:alpha/beta hydrolase [Gordonia sp. zg691]|uniref:alpha/beta hydrolase n=1 Tax=Gordonia jinghuaiqii TaxID=2758710 RepID=UPI0016625DC4|nr:alpha/beta hydrolase [Gordonia jinghuaiqii]MBD0861998.1 alpha/beta hydrolase [Gordonia jinghuaiqii]
MPGKKRQKPSQSPAKLMKMLARRGPHRVLRGDLGIVGTPGEVFTPAAGERLPAIAFGHGWLVSPDRYRDFCQHLASWGIVVAVPAGQRGVLASDEAMAADLRSALSIVSRVPLGFGAITVDPRKVGFAGHGFGAAAAVIAASEGVLHGQPQPPVRGVVALFPAPTTSTLIPAARRVSAPGLIVSAIGELDTLDGNALPLAQAYGADHTGSGDDTPAVVLRTPPGATARGLIEHRSIKSLIGGNGADKKTHTAARALTTGFLLHTLNDDPDYQAFADADTVLGKVPAVDLDDPPELQDKFAKLLGAKERKRRRAASPVPAGAPNIVVPQTLE